MKRIIAYTHIFVVGLSLGMAYSLNGFESGHEHSNITDQIETVVSKKNDQMALKKTVGRIIIGSGLIIATSLILDSFIYQGAGRKKLVSGLLSLVSFADQKNENIQLKQRCKKNWYTPEWYDANASLKENYQNWVQFHEKRRIQGLRWI